MGQSNRVFLKAGVPQSSVLSQLLFNICVNDLPRFALACRIFQYADDTVLLACHRDCCKTVQILQDDAVKVMDWFVSNSINLNVSDTTCLLS